MPCDFRDSCGPKCFHLTVWLTESEIHKLTMYDCKSRWLCSESRTFVMRVATRDRRTTFDPEVRLRHTQILSSQSKKALLGCSLNIIIDACRSAPLQISSRLQRESDHAPPPHEMLDHARQNTLPSIGAENLRRRGFTLSFHLDLLNDFCGSVKNSALLRNTERPSRTLCPRRRCCPQTC